MSETREPNEKTFHLRRQVQLFTARFLEDVHGDSFNPKAFDIVPLTVNIHGLDPVFDGYRVAVISDLHLGQWLTPLRLAGVVGMVNDLKPDLVAIPGDLVSYDLERYSAPLAENLKALKAKDGVMVVLGNHDHWAGASKVRKILQQAGVTDLVNDTISIKKGKAGLWVSGVDSVKVKADQLEKVLAKLPPGSTPGILLVHEPDFADTAAATGKFALQLSGHSHGGQVSLPFFGVPIRGNYFKKYYSGTYQVKDTILHVNRGLGVNVVWLRWNCRPEITLITLRST
jgi:predicted MPP superfamily phosphohydrolase